MFAHLSARLFAWLRSIHDRYARVILAGIAALIVPLMVMTLVATLDNWRQDNERDTLLDCFDQFANDSSTTSKAVREATAARDLAAYERDEAEATRDDALNSEGRAFSDVTHAIRKSLDGVQVGRDESRRLFVALDDALAEREAAARVLDKKQAKFARKQAHLVKVRAENPVPDPPSKFCTVD